MTPFGLTRTLPLHNDLPILGLIKEIPLSPMCPLLLLFNRGVSFRSASFQSPQWSSALCCIPMAEIKPQQATDKTVVGVRLGHSSIYTGLTTLTLTHPEPSHGRMNGTCISSCNWPDVTLACRAFMIVSRSGKCMRVVLSHYSLTTWFLVLPQSPSEHSR